jgi:hypothetical protein
MPPRAARCGDHGKPQIPHTASFSGAVKVIETAP